jgi:hypothetical protein
MGTHDGTIEPEGELIHVIIQVLETDSPLMSAQQPPLQQWDELDEAAVAAKPFPGTITSAAEERVIRMRSLDFIRWLIFGIGLLPPDRPSVCFALVKGRAFRTRRGLLIASGDVRRNITHPDQGTSRRCHPARYRRWALARPRTGWCPGGWSGSPMRFRAPVVIESCPFASIDTQRSTPLPPAARAGAVLTLRSVAWSYPSGTPQRVGRLR